VKHSVEARNLLEGGIVPADRIDGVEFVGKMFRHEGAESSELRKQIRGDETRPAVLRSAVHHPVPRRVQVPVQGILVQPFQDDLQGRSVVREVPLLFDQACAVRVPGVEETSGETDPLDFASEGQRLPLSHPVQGKLDAGRTAVDRQDPF